MPTKLLGHIWYMGPPNNIVNGCNGLYSHIHTYIHTYIHTVSTYIYTCTYIHVHTYIYTYIHAYTVKVIFGATLQCAALAHPNQLTASVAQW